MAPGAYFTLLAKNQSHIKLPAYRTPLETHAMRLTEHIHFGQHAKYKAFTKGLQPWVLLISYTD